jgi:hypothetical protein
MVEQAQQRALSGAVDAQHANRIAGVDVQADVVERPELTVAQALGAVTTRQLTGDVSDAVADRRAGLTAVTLRQSPGGDERLAQDLFPASRSRA